jgi:hypothetical protein
MLKESLLLGVRHIWEQVEQIDILPACFPLCGHMLCIDIVSHYTKKQISNRINKDSVSFMIFTFIYKLIEAILKTC